MARTQFVTLRNKTTGGTADFPPDAVPLWKGKGWEPVPADSPPAAAPAFDPSGYSVAQVQAYLEAADLAERERVVAVEKAGKNRSGITGE